MNTQSTNAYYKSGAELKAPTPPFSSGMEAGVNFVYEYSDLNFLQTRVKVLTGDYTGLILDYGNSKVVQWEDKNEFSFDYTIYAMPDGLLGMHEEQANSFQEFLKNLLCDVIMARRNDPDEPRKLMEALVKEKNLVGSIKIDSKFYNR